MKKHTFNAFILVKMDFNIYVENYYCQPIQKETFNAHLRYKLTTLE